ncbi:MAG: manganese efflux pump MntP family protein [Planctomycetota bacterium]
MSFVEIALIAVGLAMDASAVSLAVSAAGLVHGPRATFRLSFHFGLFQFLMPVAGWWLGTTVASYVGKVDHWIAFALLAFIGVRMLRAGATGGTELHGDPSRGVLLVMLSLATSIDALAVGLSLALIHVAIWYPSAIISIITGGLSLAGLFLGKRLSARFGKRMEVLGGLILVGIGVRILVGHLAA